MTQMRRTLVTVAMALGVVAASPAPALAHGAAAVTATNYQTRLKQVTPSVPGVKMRVIENGDRFELSNTTREQIVVMGYQEEPYLRIGPDGVFENRRSPASYLNASRTGDATVPGTADPGATPQWKKVSGGQVARWHDHRIHWMGDEDPPAVQEARDRRHVVIPEWTIAMRLGERTIDARGDLLWVPAPKPFLWLGLALGLFVGVVALAATKVWPRAIALVVVALVVADAVHLVGNGLADGGAVLSKLAAVAASGFFSVIMWITGGVAVWLLARRRPEGLFAAGFAGAFIALLGGVADLADLTHSQVAFAWGATGARLLVSVSLGTGLGLVGAAVLGVRRNAVPRDAAAPEAGPTIR